MMTPKYRDFEWAMGEAILEAEKASRRDEVPIGACILDSQGKIIASAGNLKEEVSDPVGHAEILAIRKACKELGDWRLTGCTLVVTLEPCLMCMGAAWQSRLDRVVFGAYDHKGGSLSLNYNSYNDARLNHQIEVMGGVRHFECSRLLSNFFKQKRASYKFKNS